MAFDAQAFKDKVAAYMQQLYHVSPAAIAQNAGQQAQLAGQAVQPSPLSQAANQIGNIGGKYLGKNAAQYVAAQLAGSAGAGSFAGGATGLGDLGASAYSSGLTAGLDGSIAGPTLANAAGLEGLGAGTGALGSGAASAAGAEGAAAAGEAAAGEAGATSGLGASVGSVALPAAILAAPFVLQKLDAGSHVLNALGLTTDRPDKPLLASDAFKYNTNFNQVPGLSNLTGDNQQKFFDIASKIGLIKAQGYGDKASNGTLTAHDAAANPYWLSAPKDIVDQAAQNLGDYHNGYGTAQWFAEPKVQAEIQRLGGYLPDTSTNYNLSDSYKNSINQLKDILAQNQQTSAAATVANIPPPATKTADGFNGLYNPRHR